MKRDWLLYLVIFSLALNFGTIGTFAYLRYQDQKPAVGKEFPPPMGLRELWHGLNLNQAQRQDLRRLLPDHRRRVRAIRGELAQKRQELFDLIKGEAPALNAIQAKIREISTLQGKLEEEMVRFLLELKTRLSPEQHAAFVSLVQGRLERALGGRGRCGPGRRGRMMRRGPGPGGPPPPPPGGGPGGPPPPPPGGSPD
jgi:Spy/CpxP family protein refolding chaperone